MKWVYNFSDPLPAEEGDAKAVLGGKGASLAEMTRAGLQVPPGFTIRTDACQRYFELGRRWPDGLEDEVRVHLARLEADTGRTFGRGDKPLLVSVRSGAAVSMPGMMDTLLNCGLHSGLAGDLRHAPWFWDRYLQFIRMFARTVDGIKDLAVETATGEASTPDTQRRSVTRETVVRHLAEYERRTGKPFPRTPWDVLIACINAVFQSWLSERAVAYRQKHVGQVSQPASALNGTAVNVQAMWPSEVSGICFTQDPTAPAANRVVIEASYGLGEAIVSGDVAPDRFLISRERPDHLEIHLGHKAHQVAAFGDTVERDPDAASLDPQQVRELYELALRVEEHFGHPVDIEWGYADGRFALLQARPIRGLDAADSVEAARQQEVARLRTLLNGSKKLWVAHNLGETLRAPTPLTWSIMRRFMSGRGGFGDLYRQLGYQPSRRVQSEGFLELIAGRIYADPDRLAELFWESMPLTYDLEALAQDRSLLDRAPAKFDAAKADGLFLVRLPRTLWSMWSAGRRMKQARAAARERFERVVVPPFLDYVRRERERELIKLTDDELLRELDVRCGRVLDEFGPESLKPGFFAGMAFDTLENLLMELGGRHEGAALAGMLTLALEDDVTFEQDRMLYDIAHRKTTLAAFLDKFGHRASGEMELARPRWREDPAYLEQTVARLRTNPGRDPAAIHEDNRRRRDEAEAELPLWLRQRGGSSLREDIDASLAEARRLLPYRESGKFYLMMGYELLRRVTEEFARRWELGGGIYFLEKDELSRFTGERSRFTELIAERRTRWQALQRLDVPDVIDSAHLEQLGKAPPVQAADELPGAAMAPGAATGVVRLVRDPAAAGDLGTDYILVCASTDPGWTPLFLNARGLVVERGGVLSHGAIVARDFGIPAVACPQATLQLRDGDTVRVDGSAGRVYVLKRG
jgi:rifampicin phosphotransferase